MTHEECDQFAINVHSGANGGHPRFCVSCGSSGVGRSSDAVFAEFLVELVTVIGTVVYQVLGLRFDHVEVKTELHESDLMVIRRMGAGG